MEKTHKITSNKKLNEGVSTNSALMPPRYQKKKSNYKDRGDSLVVNRNKVQKTSDEQDVTKPIEKLRINLSQVIGEDEQEDDEQVSANEYATAIEYLIANKKLNESKQLNKKSIEDNNRRFRTSGLSDSKKNKSQSTSAAATETKTELQGSRNESNKSLKSKSSRGKRKNRITKTRLSNHENSSEHKTVSFLDDITNETVGKKSISFSDKHLKSEKRIQGRIVKDNLDKSRRSIPQKKRLNKNERNSSPQTEVAKWVPESVSRHTKPYYEAWIDTTMAAITRKSKNDVLFTKKQGIIQNFKKQLAERPLTPELVYIDLKDEKFTGKITVRQH